MAANSQNSRRPKTSLNGFLDLLSCGVARRASNGEKTGMENRRKCSKIWKKWKQLTSIGPRTTAHTLRRLVRVGALRNKGCAQTCELSAQWPKTSRRKCGQKKFFASGLTAIETLGDWSSEFGDFRCRRERPPWRSVRRVPRSCPLIRRFAAPSPRQEATDNAVSRQGRRTERHGGRSLQLSSHAAAPPGTAVAGLYDCLQNWA
jgi:hypothetical protein